jgi:SET domain-containing protein
LEQIPCSWLSPKLESRTNLEKGGNGVYAIEPITKGDLLAMFGGVVLTGEQLKTVTDTFRSLSIQVEEDLYLVTRVAGAGDHFNHSCEPNAGLNGQIGIVAMRDIAIGEEVSFDYATCDSSDYDEFSCACGAKNCRGQVTGKDWMRSELWEKYEGYFSPYLAVKIDELKRDRESIR